MTDSAPECYRSGCPLNIALEIFGDRWTLLIVRELLFKRRQSFKELLACEEQIATNILSERLKRLEETGIITRRKDPADARRMVYRLTRKGLDLAPIMVEMVLWAHKHEPTSPPPGLIARIKSDRAAFITRLSERYEQSEDSTSAS